MAGTVFAYGFYKRPIRNESSEDDGHDFDDDCMEVKRKQTEVKTEADTH